MKRGINHDNTELLKLKKEVLFSLLFFYIDSRLALTHTRPPSPSPSTGIAGMCHQVSLLTKNS